MAIFENTDFSSHELVAFSEDRASGLKAIIAVHNSRLGPAVGGCRMYDYASSDAALKDVLRLSKGMTYKSALAGVPLGGGKAVIIGEPSKQKSRELLLAMGEFVNSLQGKYITAEDSGTSVNDLKVIAERTQYALGFSEQKPHSGDPSPLTAYGVFTGIGASVGYRLDRDIAGVKVAIQGVGNVGYHLAEQLVQAGAEVVVADVNPSNVQRAVAKLGVTMLAPEDIFAADVDVFAPCALGAAINAHSVEQIKAKIIAGAANNQLASKDMQAILQRRGILYAPDYVINAGGIIDAYYQKLQCYDTQKIRQHVRRIGQTLLQIYAEAERSQRFPGDVADAMAEAIFNAAA